MLFLYLIVVGNVVFGLNGFKVDIMDCVCELLGKVGMLCYIDVYFYELLGGE